MVILLTIKSWVGTSALGAQHYYGKLSSGDGRYDNDFTPSYEKDVLGYVSEGKAKRLNRERKEKGYMTVFDGPPYKRGDESQKYYSKEMLVADAILLFEKDFNPFTDHLVHGTTHREPGLYIAGPAKDEATRIYKAWIGCYEGTMDVREERIEEWDQLYNEWEELLYTRKGG